MIAISKEPKAGELTFACPHSQRMFLFLHKGRAQREECFAAEDHNLIFTAIGRLEAHRNPQLPGWRMFSIPPRPRLMLLPSAHWSENMPGTRQIRYFRKKKSSHLFCQDGLSMFCRLLHDFKFPKVEILHLLVTSFADGSAAKRGKGDSLLL